jgi:polyisoprenoid-binding protein YceI
VEYLGTEKNPYGKTVIGFSATTEINREDFGVNWNAVLETGGLMVSKAVKIEIDVEAQLEE